MPKDKILVIDDEHGIQETLKMILEYEGYRYFSAFTGEEGLREIEEEHPDVIFLDIKMPNMDGGEVFDILKKKGLVSSVIMISGHASISSAVDFIKRGAFDFLEKPLEREKLLVVLRNAIDKKRLTEEYRDLKVQFEEKFRLIGESNAMKRLREAIAKAAPSNSTVLIRGESGTGKELVARAIYKNSSRAERPFVKVNCAAIPEELIESELFGHEKGSFTGAVDKKIGKFEQADGGTIFLDEIGDMSPSTQAKVLNVLQEGEFTPVGGNQARKVDVRIIAATNKDLLAEVQQGRFREDLFYRLNVITFNIPPLRERKSDIPMLADHFLEEAAKKSNTEKKSIARSAMDLLLAYPWPGNVRELENAIERAALLSNGSAIQSEDFPFATKAPPLKPSLNKVEETIPENKTVALARGEKRGIVLQAVARLPEQFTAQELRRSCPGVSPEMVRVVLRELQKENLIISDGHGPGAVWRKRGIITEKG